MAHKITLEKIIPDDFESFRARILLDVARSHPRLKRVWANIDPENAASRKILLNNCFISEKQGVFDDLPGEIFGLSV